MTDCALQLRVSSTSSVLTIPSARSTAAGVSM